MFWTGRQEGETAPLHRPSRVHETRSAAASDRRSWGVAFDDPDRVRRYRFVTEELSLVQPTFNRLVNRPLLHRLPRGLAPNHITLLGHAAALLGAAALVALSPAQPRLAALAAALLTFAYCVADSVDGMQARRKGAATPLGDFLDHGLDALPGFLLPLAAIAAYGGTPAQAVALVCAYALGWWANNLGRLRTGVLVLPRIGAMEANFLLVLAHLATAVAGPGIWEPGPWGISAMDGLVALGVTGFLDVARRELPRAGRAALRAAGLCADLGLLLAWLALLGGRRGSAPPPSWRRLRWA